MANLLMTEEDVKRQLGIDSFAHIKKSQLIEFVSALPNMDKDVAIKCVEQFPHFKDYSTSIVDRFYKLCESAIERDGQAAVDAYRVILDELSAMLKKPFLRKSERHYIIEKMIEVGERIGDIQEKKRGFSKSIVQTAGAIAGVGLAIGGAILGVKLGRKS